MPEIQSRSYANTLSRYEKEAEKMREESLREGRLEELARAEQRLETVREIRKGIRETGKSPFSFHSLENPSSSTQFTLGAYEMHPDRTGRTALAPPDDFQKGNSKMPISKQMKSTIEHEELHKESHENSLKLNQHDLIRQHLGKKLEHVLQEDMASKDTTEGFDAYDKERAEASRFAARIGSTRSDVNQLLLEGKEAEIVEKARKAA